MLDTVLIILHILTKFNPYIKENKTNKQKNTQYVVDAGYYCVSLSHKHRGSMARTLSLVLWMVIRTHGLGYSKSLGKIVLIGDKILL